ncbi:MAG: SRPBCC family protein [Thermoleophilaceae bacterium]|nr:SRPBCC family protein [Thermoleophilaceae bacterium]
MGARRRTEATRVVESSMHEALSLWHDTDHWPGFIDSFQSLVERSPDWPEPNSSVVWDSIRGGRGRVTERVLANELDRFTTEVADSEIDAEQSFMAEPATGGERGVLLRLTLDYEIRDASRFQELMNSLFISRAVRDSLRRTLDRFAIELTDPT